MLTLQDNSIIEIFILLWYINVFMAMMFATFPPCRRPHDLQLGLLAGGAKAQTRQALLAKEEGGDAHVRLRRLWQNVHKELPPESTPPHTHR